MSGNKSKPSKTGDEKVKVPEEEIAAKEEKTEDDFSSKVNKYMNRSASKKKARGIDPIIAVSATVLILCCAIVIGYTIYDKCFMDHTQPNVEYGDTVEVRYVGSFYAYYDEDGSVIFDTNIEDIAKNSNYSFAHEWTAPENYDLYEVTVGSGGSLAMFEDLLIGHHPGEWVTIPASEGYPLKGGLHEGSAIGSSTNNVVKLQKVFDSTGAFETFFGSEPINDGGIHEIQSPYGWYASYSVGSGDKVVVTYKVTASDVGQSFGKDGSDVKYKIKSVSADEIIYDLELINEWNGHMVQTYDNAGNLIYITNYYTTDIGGRVAGDYDYKIKTGDTADDDREVSGETLYFMIEIVQCKSS